MDTENKTPASEQNELEEGPDFARGQRDLPEDETVRPDFARGERDEAEENVESDFARGQRDTPEDTSVHPDFARGQDAKK